MASIAREKVGSWIIDLVVDDDSHLSIWVNNEDKSEVIDTDMDIATGDEFAVRLTTKAIEEAYREVN